MRNDKTDNIKAKMIIALESTLGVVTGACKKVGIARETHYSWLKKDAEYKKAVLSIEDIAIDFAETQLHKQIKNENVVATIFYLKTKGKKRGYVERTELDHTGELTSNTVIKWGDKEIKI